MATARRFARTAPAIVYPLLLVAATTLGVGQNTRVSHDRYSAIDRFRERLAALRALRLESVGLRWPQASQEILPQVRLVLAPTIVYADSLQKDTLLMIRPKTDTAVCDDVLWKAEDDAYFYTLTAPR